MDSSLIHFVGSLLLPLLLFLLSLHHGAPGHCATVPWWLAEWTAALLWLAMVWSLEASAPEREVSLCFVGFWGALSSVEKFWGCGRKLWKENWNEAIVSRTGCGHVKVYVRRDRGVGNVIIGLNSIFFFGADLNCSRRARSARSMSS